MDVTVYNTRYHKELYTTSETASEYSCGLQLDNSDLKREKFQ